MKHQVMILATALALLTGCQGRQTEVSVFNVVLSLNPPDDPLYSDVDSAIISIDAPDMADPVVTGLTISPETLAPIPVVLSLREGVGRVFRARLISVDGRTLFASSVTADIPERRLLSLEMFFRQSGYGSASTVKVFRDELPWDSMALDSVLHDLGLTEGQSADQFYVYPSATMPGIDLHPGLDLVIISNDQPQQFYDNYALNQDRFDEFARNAGTILWCACDLGWNYGSIITAGLTLPGAVDVRYSLDQTNIVTDSDYALLDGLADSLHGNYASQEYFENLPYGAITYLTDSDGHPTMSAYELGQGWVIISGQPLEYNYDRRGLYNMGYMLPALIRFLLGVNEGGIFSYIPGSGAFENRWPEARRSGSSAKEGAPRQ